MYTQLLSHVFTFCNPMDCSPPGSSVHGISQARILKWVATQGDLPDPGIEPTSPALAGGFFTTSPPGTPLDFHDLKKKSFAVQIKITLFKEISGFHKVEASR